MTRLRRTDADFEDETSDVCGSAHDYSYRNKILLQDAMSIVPSATGVYILWLDNVAQKCGRAVYRGGLKWRLTQYYNLNYDSKAQKGVYSSVTPGNRDRVFVSWQVCPVSKSRELESKLFDKYGKGAWAKRRPHCNNNTWDLII